MAGQTLELKRHQVLDGQGMGMEAWRLIIPEDWFVEGGVSWNTATMPPEATVAYRVLSPDRKCVVEHFPHMKVFWSQDQNLSYAHMQQGYQINPPMQAEEFLRQYFARQMRGQQGPVEVLETSPLPEVARETMATASYQMNVYNQVSPLGFPFEVRADAGRIKIRYRENGEDLVEDATVAITYLNSLLPGMYGPIGCTTWIPQVYSFKAPANLFEARLPLFKVITDSRRENPAWATACTRFTASLARQQLASQQAAFERMQSIRNSQSEVDDMIMDSYNRRNAAYDRIFDNYSEAVRGVDTYTDPVMDQNIELPTGYSNAWTDGNRYIFSEDPGLNPNVEFEGDWRQLQRQGN
ncbi:MAG: hypothetical protein ACP5I4_15980 [Oceanipulchritudo sp.]